MCIDVYVYATATCATGVHRCFTWLSDCRLSYSLQFLMSLCILGADIYGRPDPVKIRCIGKSHGKTNMRLDFPWSHSGAPSWARPLLGLPGPLWARPQWASPHGPLGDFFENCSPGPMFQTS